MEGAYIVYLLAIAVLVDCHQDNDWQHFKRVFNKNYFNATEDLIRRELFLEEVVYIEQHNQRFHQGHTTFSLGVNNFSDWTLQEFRSSLINNIKPIEAGAARQSGETEDGFRAGCNPPSHDWRDLNVVTEVKDEGSCGSSWTFATVGAIEGAWAKETGLLYNLSGQEMVDCGEQHNFEQHNFETVIELGGIMTEEDYPYSCGGMCGYQDELAAAHISSYTQVPELSDNMLGTLLFEEGPIAVLIDGSLRSFKSYSSGIYWDEDCSTEEGGVNHGLLLVGYDMRQSGDQNHFYSAKNSWGTGWGMEGYVQLRMWVNTCNVARYGMYPQL